MPLEEEQTYVEDITVDDKSDVLKSLSREEADRLIQQWDSYKDGATT